ncbi:MAG TPA: hypothetical protein VGG39_16410 [Polyangiaceae bacterium]|jgi:hypothetical protein
MKVMPGGKSLMNTGMSLVPRPIAKIPAPIRLAREGTRPAPASIGRNPATFQLVTLV